MLRKTAGFLLWCCTALFGVALIALTMHIVLANAPSGSDLLKHPNDVYVLMQFIFIRLSLWAAALFTCGLALATLLPRYLETKIEIANRRLVAAMVLLAFTPLAIYHVVGSNSGLLLAIVPLAMGLVLRIIFGLRGQIAAIAAMAYMALIVVCLSVVLYLSVSNQPSAAPRELSVAEKQQAVDLVKFVSDHSQVTTHVSLTESDVNLLGRWGLYLVGKSHFGSHLQLKDGQLFSQLSVPMTPNTWLNVNADVVIHSANGLPAISVPHITVGQLPLPVGMVNQFIHSAMNSTTLADRANINAEDFTGIDITPAQLTFDYTPHTVPEGMFGLFRENQPGRYDEMLGRLYAEHILAAAKPLPRNDPRLATLLGVGFAFAKQRTAEGHDPVTENKAVLYALSMILGHPRMEQLVGRVVLPKDTRQVQIAVYFDRLRKRADLPRHFIISAAIAAGTTPDIADRIGRLKEELDSGIGGSGFSFVDLMADRAGIRFAKLVTGSPQLAIAAQDRYSRGVSEDQLLPEIKGLPEGLPDAQFKAIYGYMGSPAYNQVLSDIDERIAALKP